MSLGAQKRLLVAIAATDRTFERFESESGPALWRGKCLICNGFLEFREDDRAEREATVEHILARTNGGDPVALENLAIVHPRCNSEKGRNTDVLGPGDPKHDRVVGKLQQKRRQRWRVPAS